MKFCAYIGAQPQVPLCKAGVCANKVGGHAQSRDMCIMTGAQLPGKSPACNTTSAGGVQATAAMRRASKCGSL